MGTRRTEQGLVSEAGLAAAQARWTLQPVRGCGPAVVIRSAHAPLPAPVYRWLRTRGAVAYRSAGAVGAEALDALGTGGFVLFHADPYDLPDVLDDVAALRRAGHVGAIVALVEVGGVRTTTSIELIRAGVDEVLLTDMAVAEIASRIELASQYAVLRPGRPSTRPALFWTQPRDPRGELRLLTAAEMREILLARLRRPAYSDFVFVVLRLGDAYLDGSWRALRGRMRIGEGDLVARLEDRVLGLLFESVPEASGGEVLARVLGLHPAGEAADRVTIFRSPEDRLVLLEWILSAGPAEPG